MDYKQFAFSDEELKSIPEKLRSRVVLALSAARDWEGKTACNNLRPNERGYPVKTCLLGDPQGHVAEWRNACLAADKEVAELKQELALQGWLPIANAPLDSELVDLWVPGQNRVTDMRRIDYGDGDVRYENTDRNETLEAVPTHFRYAERFTPR